MVRRCLLLAAIVFALARAAFAQSVAVAQLSGTVVDESGGALPGVEVTVTQTSTGMTRFVVSGSGGEYVFTNLPVGPYSLTAKLQGFTTFEQTGIVLAVGDTRSVKVTLKVGAVEETITVTGNASQVETRGTGVGLVVGQEQIVGLPLNGRQPTQLVALSGGAVDTSNVGGLVSNRQPPNGVAISVAGGTGNSTLFLVDGGYNNDSGNNTGWQFVNQCTSGTYTWIGGTLGAATDWTVGTNWNPTRVSPSTSDVLIFDGNSTPPWSFTLPPLVPQACSNALEVGDPLELAQFPVTLGATTYHFQDEAFLSWFARQTPSIGYLGRYSFTGTFTSYSTPC